MRLVQLFFLIVVSVASFNAQAFEWRNLWSTPEQRAAKNLEQENYDTLVQEAPNAAWQGIGEYRQGDYKAASESFSKQHEQALANGSTPEMISSQYNRANAEVLAGNYEQALNLYDEVLELEPDHEDAKHNYEIAKQLWKQEQQQSGEQNNQQDGEQQDSDSDNQQQGEQQDQQQGQQQNQQGQPQDQQQQNDQSSDQQQNADQSGQQENQDMEQSSAESQQAEDEKAAEAMQAERGRQNEDQNSQSNQFTDQQANDDASTGSNNQLTEQEQATEQWLRQIPDDPAGLLQRKLQNRHMTDYPEVRDSANPW